MDPKGYYTFKNDEYFYQGHFKDNPITPGVILTEVMAQIGVSLFRNLSFKRLSFSEIKKPQIALTSYRSRFFFTC